MHIPVRAIRYCTAFVHVHRPVSARILALLLAAAAGLALAQDDRLERSTAELEQVRTRIRQLSAALEATRGAKDELRASLEAAERQISNAVTTLRQLDAQIKAQERRVATTQQQRDNAQASLDRQREVLAAQVRSAYVIGQQGRTKLLLNQEDPAALSRVMTYYDYFNRARSRRIAAIQAQVDALRALQERLQREIAQLSAMRDNQARQLEELEAGRAQREIAMARLEAQLRAQGRQLGDLLANEKELTRLIDSLRDVLADIPVELGNERPFARLKGALPWPVRGKLLARYGAPKFGGKLRWNGLWIAAPEGAAVRAVALGRVAYVGWMNRYGLIAVVEHDGGWYTLYGHNRHVLKSVGEWVQAGEALAEAGDTGGHRHSGVYFEIRKGSKPVNPTRWLRPG